MAPLLVEDLILPAFVSIIHGYQMATIARRVGKSRMKYKVPYPAISGDDNFLRYYRAQQNTVEFAPIFFPLLWIAAIFFHQVPAAVLGLVYCYGRDRYFEGYIQEVKQRLYGFGIAVNALRGLLVMALVGIGHLVLLKYADINIREMILSRLSM